MTPALVPHNTWLVRAARHKGILSGQLDKGLDEAPKYGWVLADMKRTAELSSRQRPSNNHLTRNPESRARS
jgi:hypothetical protein